MTEPQIWDGQASFGMVLVVLALSACVGWLISNVAGRKWCPKCKRFSMTDTGTRNTVKEIQLVDLRLCKRCGHTKWCRGGIIGYGND